MDIKMSIKGFIDYILGRIEKGNKISIFGEG